MRKTAKTATTTTTLSHIDGYHAQSDWAINYAFQGFRSNKYFTSDRYMQLDEHFRRADGKPLKGYGLEIETECSGLSNSTVYAEVLEKIIFPHFPADLFKLQRDGSLGGDVSAECITQVMTKEFIRNQYASCKMMYNTYFPAFGISCNSGRCGMHVNISNACFGRSEATQALAIRKLLYVVNHYFSLICALTARDARRTQYCGRMDRFASKSACQQADLNNMPSSHYNCCNFSHFPEGRIELRVVGGQKDFGQFRNTMESIFHLVEAVKTLKWEELDDVTKVFAGCNQYVYDRLKTLCYNAGTITRDQLTAIQPTVVHEELL